MAITLLSPVNPGPIGPGYILSVHNSAGPVPNDDYVTVDIREAATNNQICYTNFTCFGSLFPFEAVGVRAVTTPGVNQFGAWDPGRNLGGAYGPCPPGTAVTVNVGWRHANNAFVGSVGFAAGFTWDPVGALGELMIRLTAPSMTNASLDRILAAVYRPFPLN